jgi:UDP-glucose 4-epimerase
LASGRGHLRIHGDGLQTRCFLHVRDAVEALVRIAECPQLCGRAVNVGSENAISIRELADRMLAACGEHELFSYCSYGELYGNEFAPVIRRQPDTRLLRNSTGWHPKLSLSDIIRDCLEHAKHSARLTGRNAQST